MENSSKKTIIVLFNSIVMAFVFVLLFSYSTSPIYDFKEIVVDSYIFQTIGKYWNYGVIPYVGLFDHKGPMIFLINALGYKLTNNRYGVFILQVISLSIAIMVMIKMYRQEFSFAKSWILTGVSLIGLLAGYMEGNLTEEYILPFLMLAFYFWRKWVDKVIIYQRGVYHNPVIAFLYGAILGIALMTRVTNAIGVCFIVLFVTILIVINREWKNLWQNIFMFCVGFIVIVVPFFIYFMLNDSINDMWLGTIGFNLLYVDNSEGFLTQISIKNLIIFAMNFFSCYCMLFAGTIVCKNKNRHLIGIFMIVTSFFTCVLFMQGRTYSHYCTICLPYFVLSILELKRLGYEIPLSHNKKFLETAIVMFSLLYMIGGAWSLKVRYYDVVQAKIDNNAVSKLMDEVPIEERNSFIAWQCPSYLYLKYDILPYYRYFILQHAHTKLSEQLRNEVNELFQAGDAKWIMVADGHQKTIQNVLDNRYNCVKSVMEGEQKYLLYHLQN